ncbi:MAG: hypothetical protein LBF26_01525 [Puniceicoccales bacterium]|nr:hypothetical protein [Puniceicoccales bacterium]
MPTTIVAHASPQGRKREKLPPAIFVANRCLHAPLKQIFRFHNVVAVAVCQATSVRANVSTYLQ